VVLPELLIPQETLTTSLAEVAEVLVVKGDVGLEVINFPPLTKGAVLPVTPVAALIDPEVDRLNMVLQLATRRRKQGVETPLQQLVWVSLVWVSNPSK